MAIFKTTQLNKAVSKPKGGVMVFVDNHYATSDKDCIESLKKAKNVKELTKEEADIYIKKIAELKK